MANILVYENHINVSVQLWTSGTLQIWIAEGRRPHWHEHGDQWLLSLHTERQQHGSCCALIRGWRWCCHGARMQVFLADFTWVSVTVIFHTAAWLLMVSFTCSVLIQSHSRYQDLEHKTRLPDMDVEMSDIPQHPLSGLEFFPECACSRNLHHHVYKKMSSIVFLAGLTYFLK